MERRRKSNSLMPLDREIGRIIGKSLLYSGIQIGANLLAHPFGDVLQNSLGHDYGHGFADGATGLIQLWAVSKQLPLALELSVIGLAMASKKRR